MWFVVERYTVAFPSDKTCNVHLAIDKPGAKNPITGSRWPIFVDQNIIELLLLFFQGPVSNQL